MKLSYLIRGLPGHPIHPPLTDATLGTYTVATALAVADVTDLIPNAAANGWWLALVFGLVVTGPTALTGLVDWLDIERGTPLFRTATSHMLAMLTATVFFALAAILGHDGYERAAVETAPFLLTVLGFATMTLGGWLGGAVVYVHGMRVLNLLTEPTHRAVSPQPKPEKEEAEGA